MTKMLGVGLERLRHGADRGTALAAEHAGTAARMVERDFLRGDIGGGRFAAGGAPIGAARCGSRPTMPAKMMKLIPFPSPRSLINSPSHISRIVPAVKESRSDSVSKLKSGFCGMTPLADSSTEKP